MTESINTPRAPLCSPWIQQGLLKPAYIASSSALHCVGKVLAAPPTLFEHLLFIPITMLAKDALTHAAGCGILSKFSFQDLTKHKITSWMDTFFLQPFQKGQCKDFKADMMVIAPFAILILTSMTTRIGLSALRHAHQEILACYSTKPSEIVSSTPAQEQPPEEPLSVVMEIPEKQPEQAVPQQATPQSDADTFLLSLLEEITQTDTLSVKERSHG